MYQRVVGDKRPGGFTAFRDGASRYLLLPVIATAGFSLAGCFATAPIQESRTFADAARAVESAGDLILDELSVAERRLKQKEFSANPANRYEFVVTDARYQASIGEPPSTAAFRATLGLAVQYANLLLALAEGQGVDEAKGHLYEMADSVSGILGIVGLPGAGLGALKTALGPLDQLLTFALQAASIAEAKRVALEGGPIIIEVIAALTDATPAIFNVIVDDVRLETPTLAERETKVRTYRTILSNFVVLLDDLELTFRGLERAYREEGGRSTLAALAKQTASLEAKVQATRGIFATIR